MLREYYIRIKVRNRKIDYDNLEYTISKILCFTDEVKVVKEIEYTDGGYNVKYFEEEE